MHACRVRFCSFFSFSFSFWSYLSSEPQNKCIARVQARHLVAGETVWEAGRPVKRVVLVAKGKLVFKLQGGWDPWHTARGVN